MKSILGIALLVFVGIVGWRIGGSLSSDALGMAVGILFGIMAGIPATLLLLASERREHEIRNQALPPARPPERSVTPTIENHYHLHYHGSQVDAASAKVVRQMKRVEG